MRRAFGLQGKIIFDYNTNGASRQMINTPQGGGTDRLFMKLYEDWSADRITEYNFTMLSEKYQDEQQALTEQITQLKEALAADRQTTENTAKWLEMIKRYVNPTALTAEMLNELIEKIVIHEAVMDDNGQRTQKIEIYYRFVGKID
ncbi:MAG: DUF4368 domain-containing protein [Clostridia bacterium]|nr:DUF4368 domain-containing protein [Clostridia bacterium]